MRRFGTDAPEFMAFQIADSEEVYKIPLAASMPSKSLLKINGSFESQIEMLRDFMGDVVDELSAGTLNEILKAWSAASKDQGASVGESKALSD